MQRSQGAEVSHLFPLSLLPSNLCNVSPHYCKCPLTTPAINPYLSLSARTGTVSLMYLPLAKKKAHVMPSPHLTQFVKLLLDGLRENKRRGSIWIQLSLSRTVCVKCGALVVALEKKGQLCSIFPHAGLLILGHETRRLMASRSSVSWCSRIQ